MENIVDLFIIGGGINGMAIAADASGRGLSTVLCEKGDFASGTSSMSTKLIHGGLRYLELYEFKLVKEALQEREILMHRAPNLITPLEFILPHESHLRPAWLIRLGLFFYDHLSKYNSLPHAQSLNFKKSMSEKVLLPSFKKGFSYYDCFTDDARLVILNALSAKENGAHLLDHTQFISAYRDNNVWVIHLKNRFTQEKYIFYSRSLINAAGPWVKEVQKNIQSKLHFKVNLVKGSHIVIRKLYEDNQAYILQNKDRRIVFSIPYQDNFTLIGTTDVLFENNLDDIQINSDEINYLCQTMNHYFKNTITSNDIIASYSGVRCLQSDHDKKLSKITRDYKLLLDEEQNLPLITVIGGKITTHRVLAEETVNQLKPFFTFIGNPWTKDTPLPGCYFENKSFDDFYQNFKTMYAWLPDKLAFRYAKNYGTRAHILLKDITHISQLGEEFTAGLYPREVEFLIQYEWAKTAEDILWRRTKLGLFFKPHDVKKLEEWLAQ